MNIDAIYEMVRRFEVTDAYRALLPEIPSNEAAQALLAELLRTDWNVCLIAMEEDLLEGIKAGREAGDGWLSYVYARYMDCARPHMNAVYDAEEAYDIAIEAGIWDAIMYKANAWLYGDYKDLGTSEEHYIALRDDAAQRGSSLAQLQLLLDRTFGRRGYTKAEPLETYKEVETFITENEQKHLHFDPSYYRIAGYISEELGRVLEADMWYEKAIVNGDKRSFFPLAMIRACGKDYKITDVDEFEKVMQRGLVAGAADTLYSMCFYLDNEDYQAMSQEQQETVHNAIKDGLELALQLGDGTAAFFLASYHRGGRMGFEEDRDKAYEYAARGAELRDEDCKNFMDDMDIDTWDEGDDGDDGRYDAWA